MSPMLVSSTTESELMAVSKQAQARVKDEASIEIEPRTDLEDPLLSTLPQVFTVSTALEMRAVIQRVANASVTGNRVHFL